jgi:RNA polymerase sigma-70 factor (ECF subfamily)
VLQRLSPAERVVFVLHDIFGTPFPVVAQTVGRTAPACRQLARRARQKIAEGQPDGRADVTSAEHRLVTQKFIAACANGDLDGLLAVLAPDAWGDIDLGPEGPVREVVHGAAQIAANLLRFWGPATLVSQPLAGQPALLGFRDRDLAGVLVLGMRGDLIESVHVIADPRKLAALGLQLSGLA